MSLKRRIKTKIGELLLQKGVIDKKQLEDALNLQHTNFRGKLLGQILVESGATTEIEIYSVLATQFGYPYIKVDSCAIDDVVLSLVPQKTAESLSLLPLDRIDDILTIAMVNPLDEESIKKIEKLTGLKVKTFVTTVSEFKSAIMKNYGRK